MTTPRRTVPALVRADILLPMVGPLRRLGRVSLTLDVRATVHDPGLDPTIGRYAIGERVVRHVDFAGRRFGVLSPRPASNWSLGPAHRDKSPAIEMVDFSDHRSTGRPGRYPGDAALPVEWEGPNWSMHEDLPQGPDLASYETETLPDLVDIIRQEAAERLLWMDGEWAAPTTAPVWCVQWNQAGSWKASLMMAFPIADRTYRVDRLEDAVRFCSFMARDRGREPEVDGEVLEHDPRWTPTDDSLLRLAAESAPAAARDRNFVPAEMPATVVRAWHDCVTGREIVAAEGMKGAQRVLRSFVVFSDHVADTWAGRISSGYGAGFLRARLEADGFHVPAGEMEAPAP